MTTDPTPRHTARGRARRLLVRTAVTLGMLLALGIALAGLLQTRWAHMQIRDQALAWLRPKLDGVLTIGRLEGNLLGHAIVRDVVLTHRSDSAVETIRIDVMDVRYNPLGFVVGRPRLSRLRVIGPDARLIRRAGAYPIAGIWIAPSSTARGGRFAIERLIIEGGRARIEDVDSGTVVTEFQNLAADAAVSRTGDAIEISIASLRMVALTPHVPVDALSGRIVWRTPRLELHDVRFVSRETRLTGSASVDDLARWRSLDGSLSGVVMLDEWLERAQGRTAVQMTLDEADGRPRARAHLVHAGGTADATLIRRTNGSVEAEIRARHLDPSRLVTRDGGPPIPEGDIDLAARGWAGPFGGAPPRASPRPFAVELRLGPSRLGPARIAEFEGAAHSHAGGMAVSGRLRSDLAQGAFHATRGTDDRLDGRLAMELGNLRPIGALFGWVLDAEGSVRAEVHGTAADPAVFAEATLKRWTFNTLRAGPTGIEGTVAWTDRGPRGVVQVNAAQSSAGTAKLGALRADLALAGDRHEVDVRLSGGDAEARLSATITGRAPVHTIAIHTLDLASRGAALALTHDATLHVAPGDVRLDDLSLAGNAGTLEASGRFSARRLEASLDLSNLPLDRLIRPFQPALGPHLAGVTLSGTARVTGSPTAPAGRLHLDIATPDTPGTAPITLDLAGDGRVVRAAVTQRRGHSGVSARLESTIDRRNPPHSTLGGTVRFEHYPLKAIQPFINLIGQGTISRIQGEVDGAVILAGGTLNAPAGHGTLTVREGHLALKIRKITLDDIRADVRLEGPRVILKSFSATRGGTLTGHGRYAPNGWNLALTADRLVVLDDGVSHATAAGTLRLTVDAARRRADGTIRLTDVRLPLPSLSAPKAGPTKQAIASEITVVGLAESDGLPDTGAPSSPAPDWEGTVRIEVPRDAWAKGADGQIELAGAVDLRLAGTGLPGIEGEFRALRGFYRLFGVKLDLESGVVRFSGIRELNPLIDITARRTLDHYTLRVHAGGTARNPTVSFSSDPPLEQTEIVSLLATGKTTEQLTQGERSSLGRSVGSVVSSAAVGEFRKALGRQVPVDTIDVETGEDGQSDARITVGKYVSEDVFITYGQSFGPGAGSDMGIEWSISDKLTLETERRGDGNTGMDLFYTVKY